MGLGGGTRHTNKINDVFVPRSCTYPRLICLQNPLSLFLNLSLVLSLSLSYVSVSLSPGVLINVYGKRLPRPGGRGGGAASHGELQRGSPRWWLCRWADTHEGRRSHRCCWPERSLVQQVLDSSLRHLQHRQHKHTKRHLVGFEHWTLLVKILERFFNSLVK